MNTEYKYSLAKRGKVVCPRCERKTFVLYTDNSTGNPLHSTVGKCDRADNCAYHYTPKQYFQDNHISFDTARIYTPPKPSPKPQIAPSYIDIDVFKRSLRGYERNTLVQYMCGIVGDEATNAAIERYQIGTSKNGGSVFWQIDAAGKIHAGKIIQYAADGHRRKDVMPPVQWVHSTLKLPDFSLKQCLFGEHLLTDIIKPVAIVESEKTAIIASCYLPEYIWLACGGSEGLNPDKCGCLKGCNVVLYPDAGILDKWRKKAEQLRSICNIINVSDLIETEATDDEQKQGFDIADYLVRCSSPGTKKSELEMPPEASKEILPESSKEIDDLPEALEEPERISKSNEVSPHRHNSEDWTQEINRVETRLAETELPACPFRLNSFTVISDDVSEFLRNHLETVKAHNGNLKFLPYLWRLQDLINTL